MPKPQKEEQLDLHHILSDVVGLRMSPTVIRKNGQQGVEWLASNFGNFVVVLASQRGGRLPI